MPNSPKKQNQLLHECAANRRHIAEHLFTHRLRQFDNKLHYYIPITAFDVMHSLSGSDVLSRDNAVQESRFRGFIDRLQHFEAMHLNPTDSDPVRVIRAKRHTIDRVRQTELPNGNDTDSTPVKVIRAKRRTITELPNGNNGHSNGDNEAPSNAPTTDTDFALARLILNHYTPASNTNGGYDYLFDPEKAKLSDVNIERAVRKGWIEARETSDTEASPYRIPSIPVLQSASVEILQASAKPSSGMGL